MSSASVTGRMTTKPADQFRRFDVFAEYRRQEEQEQGMWRVLSGIPQTDALFDHQIIDRMGTGFYKSFHADYPSRARAGPLVRVDARPHPAPLETRAALSLRFMRLTGAPSSTGLLALVWRRSSLVSDFGGIGETASRKAAGALWPELTVIDDPSGVGQLNSAVG
jgi:hypothetical protein